MVIILSGRLLFKTESEEGRKPPALVVQNIVVKVQADPKRAERIIQKIDWESLKKLITN
jgi:hypothetical protein